MEEVELPYLYHFYTFTKDNIEVDETPTRVKVENPKIAVSSFLKSE